MSNIERVYALYIKERFPLPSERDVVALEKRINVRLPPEYRHFVLNYNGGWLKAHRLLLPPEIMPDHLDCLYGIGADHERAELGKMRDMLLFSDNNPPEVVVVGSTALGNLLVLGVHP